MVGHSFGLVSAVYNYNRRSAAINEILQRLFNLVAFNFYDDKYGFEPLGSVESAFHVAQRIHMAPRGGVRPEEAPVDRQARDLGRDVQPVGLGLGDQSQSARRDR